MVISDIKPGTPVQIIAARGVRTMQFDTTVIEVNEEELRIKIEPVYQDDKLVGFDINGVVLGLYVASKEDNRVYQFSNVSIRSYKMSDGTIFQEVTCRQKEARITNRRGAHRVWVGTVGNVLLGDNVHEHAVTVKDISATGIAFVCDDATEVTMGMPIVISFTDETNMRSFKLTATVVRHAEAGHRRIVYGCKFKEESDLIAKYVNIKQRDNMKNNNRNVEGIRKGYGVRPTE
ncbi:MAG: PilZ domain-containing protein [Lachnospiraceae bacterium]|nr:PilZ domain-containing protein [Lachnospiraceae bacterium]